MMKEAVVLSPWQQVHFVKKTMSLPFGTRPPFPKPAALPPRDATVLGNIFKKQRHHSAAAHMLWNYLTAVRSDEDEGSEVEFTASFTVFFFDRPACPHVASRMGIGGAAHNCAFVDNIVGACCCH